MPRLRQLALSCVAGTAFLLIATPAFSEEPAIVIVAKRFPHGHELVRRTVKIGDLKLATAAGQTELNKRVTYAINDLCPAARGNIPQSERQDAESCRTFAWNHARPQIKDAIAEAMEAAGTK